MREQETTLVLRPMMMSLLKSISMIVWCSLTIHTILSGYVYICAYISFQHVSLCFQVSTNGLIYFRSPRTCNFPCTEFPVIAPLWTDLNFAFTGSIYYRVAEDFETLDRVVEMLTDVNLELSDFRPTLAIIVTWFESSHFSLPSVRGET